MTRPSPQYAEVTTRLFTFGGMAIGIKILPITSIKAGEFKLELKSMDAAIGMLAILTAYLVVSAISILVQDLIEAYEKRTISELDAIQKDGGVLSGVESPPQIDGKNAIERENHVIRERLFDRAERLNAWKEGSSIVVFFLLTIFPLLFGVLVFVLCKSEIGEFWLRFWGLIKPW